MTIIGKRWDSDYVGWDCKKQAILLRRSQAASNHGGLFVGVYGLGLSMTEPQGFPNRSPGELCKKEGISLKDSIGPGLEKDGYKILNATTEA